MTSERMSECHICVTNVRILGIYLMCIGDSTSEKPRAFSDTQESISNSYF